MPLAIVQGQTTITAYSVRLTIPHVGAWIADCDLDVSSDQALPTGAWTLTVGSTQLKGTVDPLATGRFGEKAKARIVGGGNGWRKSVTKQNIHNDAGTGVQSSYVLGTIATAIGENVVDNAPFGYGPDFDVIDTLPASQVLEGRSWHVDANGITQVGTDWPPLTLGSDVDVLEYDPKAQRALIASDEPVWPGTTITDVRFGTVTVQNVDQSFSAGAGSRGYLDMGLDFDGLLEAAVEGFRATSFVAAYLYSIKSENSDGRLQLQAVNKKSGIPDSLLVPVRAGIPGFSAQYTVGTIVLVIFEENDKTRPRVVHFDQTTPISQKIQATSEIDIFAPVCKIGDASARFLAHSQEVTSDMSAISTLAGAVTTFTLAVQTVLAQMVAGYASLTPGQITAWNAAVTAIGAAVTTAQGVISAQAPTLPTTMAEGT